MKVALRKATHQDELLLRHWSSQDHVKAALGEGHWDWTMELQSSRDWCHQYIALLHTEPIGFLQVLDPSKEPTGYWGKWSKPSIRAIDIWIGEPKHLGKGYGSHMMQIAIEDCFAHRQVEDIVIDPLLSNQGAIRFYKRLGFEELETVEMEGSLSLIMCLHKTN